MARLMWWLRGRPLWRVLATAACTFAPASVLAQTQNLNLAWNANPETDIASYYVHVGTSSGNYNLAVTPVPANQLTFAFPATPGVRYYFAVKAVNTAGMWSPPSAEVVGGVPTLAQPANQTGIVGAPIAPLQLSGSDPDGGALQFSAANLPAGLSISSSGRITGTPTTIQTRTVTVSLFDGTVTVQRSFTWTIGPALASVSVVSAAPSSGTGLTQTFTLQYNDSLGAADIATAGVRFAATSNGTANSCSLSYNRSSGVMSLLDDSGTTWQSASLGSGTLANSQCAIALSGSTAASSGTTLTLTLPMTFKSMYAGAKNVYMHVASAGGAQTSWTDRGNWIVPGLTVGVTGNVPSPQAAGTPITFTASAAGGLAPYEFKWLLFDGSTWTTLRSWGAGTLSWTPSQANSSYRIGVWARDASTAADVSTFNASLDYVITAPAATAPSQPFAITGLTSNVASPQSTGTAITFTASASGGVGPYQFKYWLFDGVNWTMARNWGSATFTWTPAAANAKYRVGVWARDSTTAADIPTHNLSVPYVVTGTATSESFGVVALTPSVTGPRAVGTTVTFTASASGGSAPYQFKWWVFDGVSWTMAQNWGGNTFAWTPAVSGNYRIGVWGRDGTMWSETSIYNMSVAYTVTPSAGQLTVSGITSSVPIGAAAAPLTFTAAAAGGAAPYQFKWWVFDGTAWTMMRDWGSSTVTWTPPAGNKTYRVGVWARDSTTTANVSNVNFSIDFPVGP